MGREAAILFTEEGARVCVADVNAEAAEETVSLCAGEAFAIEVDVADDMQVASMYEQTADDGFEVRVNVKAGTRLVGAAFIKETAEPEGVLEPLTGGSTLSYSRDRNALMALDVASRGYVMETGTIALADNAKALRENEKVKQTYLGVD